MDYSKVLSNLKIGVLGGGISLERDISLLSSKEVVSILKRNNINHVFIDIFTSEKEIVKELIFKNNIDLAFIALHGEFGEDGEIQKILDEIGIPYTGSCPLASYRAMNKILSKEIFVKENIPTADYIVCRRNEFPNINKYPVVVKPYFSGSSIGVFIVNNEDELKNALEEAFSIQDTVIIEDYIDGKELTVGILEDKPLAVVEIIPKSRYFDFFAKYKDDTTFIAPAKLEKDVYKNVQETALRAHKALGCRHFSRVDIKLSKENIPYVLEINSIPGLTSHSLLPLSAKVCGISFDELILKMLVLALNEKEVKKS